MYGIYATTLQNMTDRNSKRDRHSKPILAGGSEPGEDEHAITPSGATPKRIIIPKKYRKGEMKMAMEKALVVDPQEVLNKSADMKNIRNDLSSILTSIGDAMTSLKNIWESEASNTFQVQFEKIQTATEDILKIVDEYTGDLDEIAENYMKTEQKIDNSVNELDTDIFSV